MANVKISGLPVATSAAGTDLFAIVQGGVTKQLTNTLLFTNGTYTNGNFSNGTFTGGTFVGSFSGGTFTSPTFVTPALGTPASGNLANCLGYSGANLTGTVAVANGGTGATTAPAALTNLGGTATGTALFTAANAGAGRTTLSAAALGANSDITSLSGLTTPLSVAQGGTGLTAAGTNGYVVTSNGTGFVMAPAPGAAGSVSSFSAGTTGFTPNTATTGPITLGGTLVVANGGTGLTSPGASGYLLSSNGTGFVPLATVPVANGGTGATTASGARANLSAAVSGANGDITSLTGLTTPLSVAQGGTGQTTTTGIRGLVGTSAALTKTAAYTAVAGDILACNTITTAAFTVTLPASPVAGDLPIVIFDSGTTETVNGFATNNLTVARNGSTIHTLAEDVIFSTKGVCVAFEYISGTWRIRVG